MKKTAIKITVEYNGETLEINGKINKKAADEVATWIDYAAKDILGNSKHGSVTKNTDKKKK